MASAECGLGFPTTLRLQGQAERDMRLLSFHEWNRCSVGVRSAVTFGLEMGRIGELI